MEHREPTGLRGKPVSRGQGEQERRGTGQSTSAVASPALYWARASYPAGTRKNHLLSPFTPSELLQCPQ